MSTVLPQQSENSSVFPKQPEMKVFLKKPETRLGMPLWYHHNGTKMHLAEFDKGRHHLVIASDESSIKITSRNNNKKDEWKLEWRIGNRYSDIIFFTSSQLRAAFGLSNDPGKTGKQIIKEFGADSAEENMYIRYGDFVNIPRANGVNACYVSIYIDDEMKSAIQKLLPS